MTFLCTYQVTQKALSPFTANRSKGFTLIEIAIVLVIVSLVLGGAVAGFGSLRDSARYSETELYLEEAREALLNFALVQGHLPCPDSDNDGVQNAAAGGTTCTANRGNLPWIDLGLQQFTPWDVTAFYAVNQAVTSDVCSSAGQSVCFFEDNNVPAFNLRTPPQATDAGTGNLTVNSHAGTAIAANVLAVVGVLGKNALASTPASCASLHADETENCNTDATFVMDNIRSNSGSYFDDQLVWIHANILKGRLHDAGLL